MTTQIELKDRKAFGECHNGKKTPIYALDAEGNRWDFPSINEAAQAILNANLCRGAQTAYNVQINISRNLRANSHTAYGLKFYYK